MADPRPLRCAVIGAGRMGMVHGHLLQVYPGTELVGFVDPQAGTAGRLASQGLRAPVYASVPELYADLPIVESAHDLIARGVLGEVLRFTAHAYISEVFSAKSGWFFQKELSG